MHSGHDVYAETKKKGMIISYTYSNFLMHPDNKQLLNMYVVYFRHGNPLILQQYNKYPIYVKINAQKGAAIVTTQ